jgi:hypothetical protein
MNTTEQTQAVEREAAVPVESDGLNEFPARRSPTSTGSRKQRS